MARTRERGDGQRGGGQARYRSRVSRQHHVWHLVKKKKKREREKGKSRSQAATLRALMNVACRAHESALLYLAKMASSSIIAQSCSCINVETSFLFSFAAASLVTARRDAIPTRFVEIRTNIQTDMQRISDRLSTPFILKRGGTRKLGKTHLL